MRTSRTSSASAGAKAAVIASAIASSDRSMCSPERQPRFYHERGAAGRSQTGIAVSAHASAAAASGGGMLTGAELLQVADDGASMEVVNGAVVDAQPVPGRVVAAVDGAEPRPVGVDA